MKPLSVFLVIVILASGFSQPPAMHVKMNEKVMRMMMQQHKNKDGCCNKNKPNSSGAFCNFCVLCIAFIVPVKPGIERNFVSVPEDYPEMVRSKLTDYNSLLWRPPNV